MVQTQTHTAPKAIEILLPSIKYEHIGHGRKSRGIIIWYKENLAPSIVKVICLSLQPMHRPRSHHTIMRNSLIGSIQKSQLPGPGKCEVFNARSGTGPGCIDAAGNKHTFNNLSAPSPPLLLKGMVRVEP